MVTAEDIAPVLNGGGQVVSTDGGTVGRVADVFLAAGSAQPAWVSVVVGRLRHRTVLVPLDGASADGTRLTVPFPAKLVRHAPTVEAADGRLTPADEAGLRAGQITAQLGTDPIVLGGDIVTAVDGRPVRTADELRGAVAAKRSGAKARITFLRGDDEREVEVELARRPADGG